MYIYTCSHNCRAVRGHHVIICRGTAVSILAWWKPRVKKKKLSLSLLRDIRIRASHIVADCSGWYKRRATRTDETLIWHSISHVDGFTVISLFFLFLISIDNMGKRSSQWKNEFNWVVLQRRILQSNWPVMEPSVRRGTKAKPKGNIYRILHTYILRKDKMTNHAHQTHAHVNLSLESSNSR